MEGEPERPILSVEKVDGQEILTIIEQGTTRQFVWDPEGDYFRKLPGDVNELINQGD